jgi:hypothetical protein
MAITADTWAVVAATGLGPVLAVALTLGFTYWREKEASREKAREAIYSRRLHVFRVLMSTRRMGISPDHVNAINLVEVDLYVCAAVETEWKPAIIYLRKQTPYLVCRRRLLPSSRHKI